MRKLKVSLALMVILVSGLVGTSLAFYYPPTHVPPGPPPNYTEIDSSYFLGVPTLPFPPLTQKEDSTYGMTRGSGILPTISTPKVTRWSSSMGAYLFPWIRFPPLALTFSLRSLNFGRILLTTCASSKMTAGDGNPGEKTFMRSGGM